MSECLDPTLLQFLIENLPIGIMVTDSQGCMVKVNAHHANMTGHPRETLIGRPFSDVVAEGGANASCSMRVIETGLPMVFEQTVSPGKPDEKEIIVKCIPMHDENGVLQYVVNYLLDISDKNLLINQLRKVQFNNERYRMELKQFRTQESRTNKFIYRSTAMNALLEKAEKIAAQTLPCCLPAIPVPGKACWRSTFTTTATATKISSFP